MSRASTRCPLRSPRGTIFPSTRCAARLYAGELGLSIVGLDEVQRVGINFRSPNFVQRYIAPIVVPVYSTPWAFCTVPLTLLLLLVSMARFRGRNLDEDAIEEAAMAATRQMAAETFAPPPASRSEKARAPSCR